MPFPVRTPRRAAVSWRAVFAVFPPLAVLIPLAVIAGAQNPAPNSDPAYQALRNLTLSGEAVSVSNF